ncbi:MAG: DUF721 domain-containing protein [Deltaproteobacteria bacterium]|nr:DUF721 domain-containing protein [Deltaproteobacteria bacterium]
MRKLTKPTSMAKILSSTIKQHGWTEPMEQHRLWSKWTKIVGDAVAAHTSPGKWNRGDVVIYVENASWLQELQYMKVEVLSRIRREFPTHGVRTVRFEVGKVLKSGRNPGSQEIRSRKLRAEEVEFIGQVAQEVKDDEMRQIIQRAMTKAFQRNG